MGNTAKESESMEQPGHLLLSKMPFRGRRQRAAAQGGHSCLSYLGPVGAVQSSVLDGFAEMARLDICLAVKVRNRSRHLQDAVMRPRGQSQSRDGVLQQLFALGRNYAILAKHLRHHLRVCVSFLL